jgi:hypothetical protein
VIVQTASSLQVPLQVPLQVQQVVTATTPQSVTSIASTPSSSSTSTSTVPLLQSTSGFSPLGISPPALSLDKGQLPIASGIVSPPIQSSSGPMKAALPPPPLSPPPSVMPQSPFPSLASSVSQLTSFPTLPPPPLILSPLLPPPSPLDASNKAKKEEIDDRNTTSEIAAKAILLTLEEDAKIQADKESKLKAEADLLQAEITARLAAETEAAKKLEEAEAARLAAETEAAKKRAEAEAARLAIEAEAARKLAEAEAARLAAETEATRKLKEVEAARLAIEAEAAKKLAEAEAARLAKEAEAAKKLAEEKKAAAQEALEKDRLRLEEDREKAETAHLVQSTVSSTVTSNGIQTSLSVLPPPPISLLPPLPPSASLSPPALPPPSLSPPSISQLPSSTLLSDLPLPLPLLNLQEEVTTKQTGPNIEHKILTPVLQDVYSQQMKSSPSVQESSTDANIVTPETMYNSLPKENEHSSTVVNSNENVKLPIDAIDHDLLQSKIEEERTMAELNALNERMEDKKNRVQSSPTHHQTIQSSIDLSSTLSPGVSSLQTDSIRNQLEQMAATVQLAISRLPLTETVAISISTSPSSMSVSNINEKSPLKSAVDMLQNALAILGVVASQNNPELASLQFPQVSSPSFSSSFSSSSSPMTNSNHSQIAISSPITNLTADVARDTGIVSTHVSLSPQQISTSSLLSSVNTSLEPQNTSKQSGKKNFKGGMNVAEFAKSVRERLQDLMNEISKANKELDSLSGTPLKPFLSARKAVLSANREAALDELRTLRDVLNELNDGEHAALFMKKGSTSDTNHNTQSSPSRNDKSGSNSRPPWDPAISRDRTITRANDIPSTRVRSKSRTSRTSSTSPQVATTATTVPVSSIVGGRAVLMENRRHHVVKTSPHSSLIKESLPISPSSKTEVTTSKSPMPSPRQLAVATSATSIMNRSGGRSLSTRSKSPSSSSSSNNNIKEDKRRVEHVHNLMDDNF